MPNESVWWIDSTCSVRNGAVVALNRQSNRSVVAIGNSFEIVALDKLFVSERDAVEALMRELSNRVNAASHALSVARRRLAELD